MEDRKCVRCALEVFWTVIVPMQVNFWSCLSAIRSCKRILGFEGRREEGGEVVTEEREYVEMQVSLSRRSERTLVLELCFAYFGSSTNKYVVSSL